MYSYHFRAGKLPVRDACAGFVRQEAVRALEEGCEPFGRAGRVGIKPEHEAGDAAHDNERQEHTIKRIPKGRIARASRFRQ